MGYLTTLSSSIKNAYKQISIWWDKKLWQPAILKEKWWRPWIIIPLRVIAIIAESFSAERIKKQAASLTYVTLLSLVPFLAVIFSIFTVFGGLDKIEGTAVTTLVTDHHAVS